MHTPWGTADHIVEIEKGVRWVSTPSHGGLMVSLAKARKIFSERAIDVAFPGTCGGYVFWEEDCSYAVAFFEHPEIKRAIDQDSLNDWNRENPSNPYTAKAKADAVPRLTAEIAKTDDEIKADMRAIVAQWNPEYFGEQPSTSIAAEREASR